MCVGQHVVNLSLFIVLASQNLTGHRFQCKNGITLYWSPHGCSIFQVSKMNLTIKPVVWCNLLAPDILWMSRVGFI